MSWSQEQRHNAGIIIRVGRRLGASNRDITIALMAAIVESGLRNLSYGDRDSVGLFQQRAPWGSFAQRTNPAEAARMFFQGGHSGQRGLFDIPGRNGMSLGRAAQAVQVSAYPDRYAIHEPEAKQLLGIAPEVSLSTPFHTDTANYTLRAVPGIDNMTQGLGSSGPVSQSVNIVNPLGEITADGMNLGDQTDPSAVSPLDAVAEAPQQNALGELTFDNSGPGSVPQATDMGGGGGGGGLGGGKSSGFGSLMADLHMPSYDTYGGTSGGDPGSVDQGAALDTGGVDFSGAPHNWAKGVIKSAQQMLGTPYVWGGSSYGGVDCSGLIQMVFKQHGINLPRVSADQARAGTEIPLNDLQPGDLVAWDNSSRNNGADHIALYIGGGKIIEAARPGTNVQISNIYDQGRAWGVRLPQAGAHPAVGPGTGDWGVQSYVASAGHKIAQRFGITSIGGYNDRNIAGTSTKSDHAYGLALDFMGGKQDLADYTVKNAGKLGVSYVIYNRRIWSAERAGEGWRPYGGEDPHTDHVHVSFNPNDAGTSAFEYHQRPPTRAHHDPTSRKKSQPKWMDKYEPPGWDGRYPNGGPNYHPATHSAPAHLPNASGPSKPKPPPKKKKPPHQNSGASSGHAHFV